MSQNDRDFDVDFESDDILALNMSTASKALARSLGFRLRSEPLGNLRLWLVRLRAPPGMNAQAALARLGTADPKGLYGINESYSLAEGAQACVGIRCYGEAMVGWSTAGCPIAARIGMVDSALDLGLPALAHSAIKTRRFGRGRASSGEMQHGSSVAALLVGKDGFNGLLPDAQLYAADVFSADRSGRPSTDAARITRGLDWLAGVHPLVVNMSLEGPDSAILRVAIARLRDQGVNVVAAAGNHGPTAPPEYPGAFPGVIAVTAIDRFEQVYAMANRGDYIAVAAPGVGIWTVDTGGGGSLRDGTSFAAPFVTAAVALIRAGHPKITPEASGEFLKQHARDLGAPGRDPVFGAGLVQAPDCPVIQSVNR